MRTIGGKDRGGRATTRWTTCGDCRGTDGIEGDLPGDDVMLAADWTRAVERGICFPLRHPDACRVRPRISGRPKTDQPCREGCPGWGRTRENW